MAVALAVSIAVREGPIVPRQFLNEIAAAVEQDDMAFAAALRSSSRWISLSPTEAARQLHQSNLDPAYPEWQGISAFVVTSVIWSLYAFLRSPDDYWETVCTAIAVGGDTDSTAAMAGAMGGARAGAAALPQSLLGRLTDRGEWGAGELILLATGLRRVVVGMKLWLQRVILAGDPEPFHQVLSSRPPCPTARSILT